MAATTSAGDMQLDSLPYYDNDLEAYPQLRAVLNSQIAIELRNLLPKTPSQQPTNLSHLPPPRPLPSSSSDGGSLWAAELARVESKRPLRAGEQGLDTSRYAMPFPSEEEQDDVAAWERAYKSSLAQLEHQRLRTMNGTLLQQLGANKWRVENFALENAIKRVENEATETKEVVEGVNRRRKADQEKAGETLARLERRWQELVSGNMQLEIGCFALEEELAVLQARHGELQQRLQAAQ
ncbi:hypothetical protein JCM10908_002879 [Rhodotorula pacifica]|uniref:pre-mRNA-splicing factor SPF27 family protein n=1 Tax=Rhodotorula pacifica TaxID=1495444 RepID=UPI00316E6712